jgi:crotonobetainyl-CoA:carnitine CoA-transferase CaiB-like acyl-CoA transferase
MRLGDLGANVIKVEPKTGDPARGFMQIIGVDAGLKGRNYYFENNNRNKRSIVIDLGNTKGKDLFLRLIDTADVFLTNLSIDAPAKLGISPDTLLQRNPRLIYAHASGWGRNGPDAHDYSFDYTGIARSGLMMSCGQKDEPPAQILPGIGDELGGLICAWAITAALFAREKTGKGQVVDTSLMGSLISTLGLVMAAPAILGQEFPRSVRAEAGNPLYNHYRCQDDRWLAIAHLQPDRYWSNVCTALGLPECQDDPRFNTIQARSENSGQLIAILDQKFAARPRDEWLAILKKEGCICSPVQSPLEVSNDPQAIANEYFIYAEHPVWGRTKVVGFPWAFSETPASWRREAPEFGQHTEEILLEMGYTWDDIAAFKEEGATI